MSAKNIIFVSPVDFAALFQRHQAFATLLAEKNITVYYVNPLLSNGLSASINSISNNLKIVTLRVPFRATSFPELHRLAVILAKYMLKQRLKLNFSKTPLWIADPAMAALANSEFKTILYDRCDLHGFFPGQRASAWEFYEKLLYSAANLVTLSHERLLQDVPSQFKQKSVLVPNACSMQVSKLRQRTHEGSIQILSSGAHYEWVNLEWLQMFANNPKIILNIAGTGRGRNFSQLIKSKNVIFHGKLAPHKLNDLLKNCEVGLVPFINSELTSAVDPIKAYEYAAAGLEIWAPTVSGLKKNALIDKFVDDRVQLEASLVTYLSNRKTAERPKSVPRWPERLNTILDRLPTLRSD